MSGIKDFRIARKRRHERVRKQIRGTASRPRLCVFRSLNNIYAQIIDDVAGCTIASASTLVAEIKQGSGSKGNKEMAELVGALVAKRGREKGGEQVVFDRGGS